MSTLIVHGAIPSTTSRLLAVLLAAVVATGQKDNDIPAPQEDKQDPDTDKKEDKT